MVGRNIMFVFTPEKTLVVTPLQLFMIKHSHGNYIRRLKGLKDVVKRGDINNMSDLVAYNGFKASNNIGQFDGLELVRIDASWVK